MPPQSICSDLHSLVRILKRYSFPIPEASLPENGIYFMFEDGEHAHGSERIVRVGSHTGTGNLAARLKEHLTQDKDRSIFRKHVGRAILARANDPFIEQWNLDLTSRKNRERYGYAIDREKQGDIEAAVSHCIQAKMSVAVIPTPDSGTALRFERLCIGTLSRCSGCASSTDWLGSFSPVEKIRHSGLWQVQGLSGEGLSESDLTTLTRFAGKDTVVDLRPQSVLADKTNFRSVQDGIELNQLLTCHHIDPASVLVVRHSPFESELRKVLPWLAAERTELFNAYQQAQGDRVEAALGRARYLASFIGHEPKKAAFVGLYEVRGSQPLTFDQFWAVPANIELAKYGMRGFTQDDARPSLLWFDLACTGHFAAWKGKLIVDWPGLERSWWRWADRNSISVGAILEESLLDAGMPSWELVALAWKDLAVLPSRWKSVLSQWRGVYFIFDREFGKGYVGSACGQDNLLGRWLGYSTTGHGGNVLLRKRDPENFVFTILQRVSPDMEANEVVQLETSWKERLHTRSPFGLNDN